MVPFAPGSHFRDNALRRARITKRGRPDADEARTRHHVLDGIRARRDTADADHRDMNGARDLPCREHADRENGGTADTAGPESDGRLAVLDVDDESGNG